MVRPGRDLLCGTVEVDETYVGGAEKGKRGRETETKAIVAVAAEENGKGIGRIRLRRVKDVSGASPPALRSVRRSARRCDPHRRMEWVFRADGSPLQA